MSDCLFCKILNGDIPAELIYEDDHVAAFNDINPQAPHHFLCIPKKHISTTNDLQEADAETMGKLVLAAAKIAKDRGIAEDGYRLVVNCNNHGGQTVFHIHMHVLAGRHMTWPPG